MKKIISCIIAIAALATAQVKADTFNWGITAGMNTTTPEFEGGKLTNWEPDSETGWYAGLQFRFAAPVIGLGADFGIVYSQETLNCDEAGIDKESVGYISVPVHLRYELRLPIVNDIVTPFVLTGPQISYNVKKLDEELNKKEDRFKNFNTKDLVCHWDLGGGLLLFERLQVGYHYSFPITNLAEFNAVNAEQIETVKSEFKMGTHHLGVTLFF